MNLKKLSGIFLSLLLLSASIGLQAAQEPATQTAVQTSAASSVKPAAEQGKSPVSMLPPLDMVEAADTEETKEPGVLDKIKQNFHINFVEERRWTYLWIGFQVTMQVALGATVLGILIGFLVAVIRNLADISGKLKVLNFLCKVYLTVFRGTPVVVQLLFIYFVIFASLDVDKVLVAIIAFGVNSGAYVTEIIRSGINAVDSGQLEAGRSLGLSYLQTMRYIILPQAFKNVLPALGNEFIALLKETSISGYIALQDLTKGGDIIRSQTYDAFLPLTAVALIYLAIVMLFSWLMGRLERRLRKNER